MTCPRRYRELPSIRLSEWGPTREGDNIHKEEIEQYLAEMEAGYQEELRALERGEIDDLSQ